MLSSLIISAITVVELPQFRITILTLVCLWILANAIADIVTWASSKHLVEGLNFKQTWDIKRSTTLEYTVIYLCFIVLCMAWRTYTEYTIVSALCIICIVVATTYGYSCCKAAAQGLPLERSILSSADFKAILANVTLFSQFCGIYRVCLISCFMNHIPIDSNLLLYYADFYIGDIPSSVVSLHAINLVSVGLTELVTCIFLGWLQSAESRTAEQGINLVWNQVFSFKGNLTSYSNTIFKTLHVASVWDFVQNFFIVHCDSEKQPNSFNNIGNITGNNLTNNLPGTHINKVNGSTKALMISSNNILWADGYKLERCRNMLQAQYNYSESAYPVLHKYLTTHCADLIASPVGDTGISFDKLNLGKMKTDLNCYITPTYSSTLLQGAPSSGVYGFFNPSTGDFYIGSSINAPNRLKYHYQVTRWPEDQWPIKTFYKALTGHFDEFIFTIVGGTRNHFDLYTAQNPSELSNPIINHIRLILNDFSTYEVCLLEHSIIEATGPTLNGPDSVSFKYNWNPLDSFDPKGVKNEVLVIATGDRLPFDSIGQAVKYTKVPQTTFIEYLNYNVELTSSELGQIKVYKPDYPIIDGPIPKKVKYPIIAAAEYDFERISGLTLDPMYIYALDDNNTILHKFMYLDEAASLARVEARKISIALNKIPISVKLPGVGIAFFAVAWETMFQRQRWAGLWQRKEGKSVISVNTLTGQVLLYVSETECARFFKYAKANSSWVRSHLKEKNPFIYQGVTYHLCYKADYKGDVTPVLAPRNPRPDNKK